MIKVTLLWDAAKACTPTLGKTLRNAAPKIEGSVAEVARMANAAKGSELGKLFSSLSEAGDCLVGHDGLVTLTTRKSAKHSDATIFTLTFKKGKEIIAQMANWVSPNKQQVGGMINQHVGGSVTPGRFGLTNVTLSNAEKAKQLAEKAGVKLDVASDRITTARLSGKNIADEAVLQEVISPKVLKRTKPHKIVSEKMLNDPEVLDELPADAYFGLGYRRLAASGNEDRLLKTALKDKNIRAAVGLEVPKGLSPLQQSKSLNTLSKTKI